MSDRTDAADLYQRLESFLFGLAQAKNLGIGLGTWSDPRLGPLRFIAVFGWTGRIYVTMFACETDARWALGQARLRWYMNDGTEPFEFKILGRSPMAETAINDDSDLYEEIGARLRWLEAQPSIEAALVGLYAKALRAAAEPIQDAAADTRRALAEEVPNGDEEEP